MDSTHFWRKLRGSGHLVRHVLIDFCVGSMVKDSVTISRRVSQPILGFVELFIRKSSSFILARSCALNHRGCLPRPAHVFVEFFGFWYLGRTFG